MPKNKKGRRSSILKAPKPRNPLAEVSFAPERQVEPLKRRVSFASSNSIKQFATDAETNTIWDSTYEESLSKSDHSQNLSDKTPDKNSSSENDVLNCTRVEDQDMSIELSVTEENNKIPVATKIIQEYIKEDIYVGITQNENRTMHFRSDNMDESILPSDHTQKWIVRDNKENNPYILPEKIPSIQFPSQNNAKQQSLYLNDNKSGDLSWNYESNSQLQYRNIVPNQNQYVIQQIQTMEQENYHTETQNDFQCEDTKSIPPHLRKKLQKRNTIHFNQGEDIEIDYNIKEDSQKNYKTNQKQQTVNYKNLIIQDMDISQEMSQNIIQQNKQYVTNQFTQNAKDNISNKNQVGVRYYNKENVISYNDQKKLFTSQNACNIQFQTETTEDLIENMTSVRNQDNWNLHTYPPGNVNRNTAQFTQFSQDDMNLTGWVPTGLENQRDHFYPQHGVCNMTHNQNSQVCIENNIPRQEQETLRERNQRVIQQHIYYNNKQEDDYQIQDMEYRMPKNVQQTIHYKNIHSDTRNEYIGQTDHSVRNRLPVNFNSNLNVNMEMPQIHPNMMQQNMPRVATNNQQNFQNQLNENMYMKQVYQNMNENQPIIQPDMELVERMPRNIPKKLNNRQNINFQNQPNANMDITQGYEIMKENQPVRQPEMKLMDTIPRNTQKNSNNRRTINFRNQSNNNMDMTQVSENMKENQPIRQHEIELMERIPRNIQNKLNNRQTIIFQNQPNDNIDMTQVSGNMKENQPMRQHEMELMERIPRNIQKKLNNRQTINFQNQPNANMDMTQVDENMKENQSRKVQKKSNNQQTINFLNQPNDNMDITQVGENMKENQPISQFEMELMDRFPQNIQKKSNNQQTINFQNQPIDNMDMTQVSENMKENQPIRQHEMELMERIPRNIQKKSNNRQTINFQNQPNDNMDMTQVAEYMKENQPIRQAEMELMDRIPRNIQKKSNNRQTINFQNQPSDNMDMTQVSENMKENQPFSQPEMELIDRFPQNIQKKSNNRQTINLQNQPNDNMDMTQDGENMKENQPITQPQMELMDRIPPNIQKKSNNRQTINFQNQPNGNMDMTQGYENMQENQPIRQPQMELMDRIPRHTQIKSNNRQTINFQNQPNVNKDMTQVYPNKENQQPKIKYISQKSQNESRSLNNQQTINMDMTQVDTDQLIPSDIRLEEITQNRKRHTMHFNKNDGDMEITEKLPINTIIRPSMFKNQQTNPLHKRTKENPQNGNKNNQHDLKIGKIPSNMINILDQQSNCTTEQTNNLLQCNSKDQAITTESIPESQILTLQKNVVIVESNKKDVPYVCEDLSLKPNKQKRHTILFNNENIEIDEYITKNVVLNKQKSDEDRQKVCHNEADMQIEKIPDANQIYENKNISDEVQLSSDCSTKRQTIVFENQEIEAETVKPNHNEEETEIKRKSIFLSKGNASVMDITNTIPSTKVPKLIENINMNPFQFIAQPQNNSNKRETDKRQNQSLETNLTDKILSENKNISGQIEINTNGAKKRTTVFDNQEIVTLSPKHNKYATQNIQHNKRKSVFPNKENTSFTKSSKIPKMLENLNVQHKNYSFEGEDCERIVLHPTNTATENFLAKIFNLENSPIKTPNLVLSLNEDTQHLINYKIGTKPTTEFSRIIRENIELKDNQEKSITNENTQHLINYNIQNIPKETKSNEKIKLKPPDFSRILLDTPNKIFNNTENSKTDELFINTIGPFSDIDILCSTRITDKSIIIEIDDNSCENILKDQTKNINIQINDDIINKSAEIVNDDDKEIIPISDNNLSIEEKSNKHIPQTLKVSAERMEISEINPKIIETIKETKITPEKSPIKENLNAHIFTTQVIDHLVSNEKENPSILREKILSNIDSVKLPQIIVKDKTSARYSCIVIDSSSDESDDFSSVYSDNTGIRGVLETQKNVNLTNLNLTNLKLSESKEISIKTDKDAKQDIEEEIIEKNNEKIVMEILDVGVEISPKKIEQENDYKHFGLDRIPLSKTMLDEEFLSDMEQNECLENDTCFSIEDLSYDSPISDINKSTITTTDFNLKINIPPRDVEPPELIPFFKEKLYEIVPSREKIRRAIESIFHIEEIDTKKEVEKLVQLNLPKIKQSLKYDETMTLLENCKPQKKIIVTKEPETDFKEMTLDEKIKLKSTSKALWDIENVEKHSEVMKFSFYYKSVIFVANVNLTTELVTNLKIYYRLDKEKTDPNCVYVLKMFVKKLSYEHIHSCCGEPYTILTLLDYISLLRAEMYDMERELEYLKYFHRFKMNQDLSAYLEFSSFDLLWLFQVHFNMLELDDNISKNLTVNVVFGDVQENNIKIHAKGKSSGYSFIREYSNSVNNYIKLREKDKKEKEKRAIYK